jgi:hypothetical protein
MLKLVPVSRIFFWSWLNQMLECEDSTNPPSILAIGQTQKTGASRMDSKLAPTKN